MKNSIIIVVTLILNVTTCFGQTKKESLLMKKAIAGDAKSQYVLATHYYYGSNLYAINYHEAIEWLIKSAEQDYSEAQDFLGYCYCMGQGVQQNYTNAVYWYKRAAELNNANAQRNLAICYEKGQGVARDMKIAVDWFKKSAENGSMDSQLIYAKYLLNGKYIAKDSVEACFWLFCSAQGGRKLAQSREKCNQEASECLKKLADNEYSSIIAYAKYYYGKLCYVFDEYFDAERYLYESYQFGCYDAAAELGWIYYMCDYGGGAIRTNTSDDISIQRHHQENQSSTGAKFRNRKHRYENDNAEYWFNEAIFRKLDDTDMLNWHLCNIYSNNGDYKRAAISLEHFFATRQYFNGPCEDYLRLADLYLLSDYKANKAFEIYKERFDAIEKNLDNDLNDNTWYNWIVCGLGKCYYMGKGVPQSYETAAKYFKIAADNEDPEGMQLLSKCYRFGRGVAKNISMAETLMKRSENLEDPTALRIRTLLE